MSDVYRMYRGSLGAWVLAAAFGFGLIGCGSADPARPDASDGAGGGGGAHEGDGGPLEGSPDGGDGGSPAAVTPADLLPLSAGNVWTYTVAELPGETTACELGIRSSSMASGGTEAGREAIVYQHWCASETFLISRSGSDIDREDSMTHEWKAYLLGPITDGAEYELAPPGVTMRWEFVGEVPVPAGTFSGCWALSQVGAESRTTYCPGVGAVQVYSPSAGVGAVLESYELHPENAI